MTGSKADGSLFVGREAELRRLERAAQLDFNVLALGERGIGLTSLMGQHQRRMEVAGRSCFYLSGTKINSAGQVYEAIRTGGMGSGQIPDPIREVMGLPEARSAFHNLVWDIHRVDAEVLPVVILDDMHDPKLTHQMFGRYRDEMWELPCRWVVCGLTRHRSQYLTPPADAFFEAEVVIGPMDASVAGDLLEARLATAGSEDAQAVGLIRSNEERIIREGGGNPRQILASARDALLRDTEENAGLERLRQEATKLGEAEGRIWRYLLTHGPASASDEELLENFGITRARAAQVLGHLEKAGLAAAYNEKQGVGRPRKFYRAGVPHQEVA